MSYQSSVGEPVIDPSSRGRSSSSSTAATSGRALPLTRDFYDRPVLEVAPELLGCVVRHGRVAVRVTEVEAYAGERDPGSHAFRGRTARNAVMFGPPGHLYCYFTYGMHTCCNLVCGPEGEASAVLLRGGEVVDGEPVARARRERSRPMARRDLARGPARLVQALGLDLSADGRDVTDPRGDLTLSAADPAVATGEARTGPRVGVRGPGGDGTAYPWRFWLADEATVSTYRPAAPRPRAGRGPA